MSLGVLNNIAAIYAQNNLNQTQNSLQNVLQQLSSGSRINSGADDAAGLALADGLHANEAALTQSSQNATAGVGLLQTADGALSQVTNLLNRAVTLATEASNGTLNANQVSSANQEYQNILTEIGNIGSTTNFNGNSVFSSAAKTVFVSDGTSSGATTYSETIGGLNAASVGTSNAVATTATATPSAPSVSGAAVQSSSTIAFTAGTDAASGTLQLGVGTGPQHSIALTGPATGVAALINGDATFAAEGITASFTGTTLTINGPANGSGSLVYGGANNVSDAGSTVTPSVPTAASTGESTSTIALTASQSLAGTLSLAVGAGSAHSITVAAGTSGTALAAQINGDSTYQTAGVTAAYNSTTGSLTISGPTGAGKNLNFSGTALTNTGSTGVDFTGSGVSTLSAATAQNVLTSVTSAIQDVAYQRGNIGASINELNAASNVASSESVNLTSAESSIRSTNYGQATSDMAKFQVLSQTGISALAQANSVQQEILKLMQ
ncbi:MAG TPA: flagellin [Edaphobacter sp.]|uniref:flagellin N-terminal helical domain-containing protein n=1 Tax=Edaphobacter sp. TaxID=1934404 RepID=UPI002BEBC316|nr:flagellin [Edaphobacter sp.]HUZ97556.1 flagellin [Edaphobacter sp.]